MAMQSAENYVLTSRYNDETGYSNAELTAKGTIKHRLDELETQIATLLEKPEYKLTYTASELEAKLANL